ncbi:hypothetical protein CDAR_94721 [Caerostris darwini]|uniref:Uncharacterized protein n=1 Tax=Caerostris darwini TaxID=1538125 RepID=A0AAV4PKN6_9ARAC|nr:hypothetical protein CDAR_94721 [Caerostris darwini]
MYITLYYVVPCHMCIWTNRNPPAGRRTKPFSSVATINPNSDTRRDRLRYRAPVPIRFQDIPLHSQDQDERTILFRKQKKIFKSIYRRLVLGIQKLQ